MGKQKPKLLIITMVALLASILTPIMPLFTSSAKAAPPTFSYLNMYQIVGSDNTIYQTVGAGVSTVNNSKIEFVKIYPNPLKFPNQCTSSTLEFIKSSGKWKYFEQKSGNPPCTWTNGVEIPAPSNPSNALKLYTWSIGSDSIRRFGYGDIGGVIYTKTSYNGLELYRKNASNPCSDTLIIGALPNADFYSVTKSKFATYWNSSQQKVDYRVANKASNAAPETGCAISWFDQEGSGSQATVFITSPNFEVNAANYNTSPPVTTSGSTYNTLSDEQKKSITNVEGATNGQDTEAGCEAGIPVLGWFICNVLELASDFAGWVDEQLDGILKINTSQYNNDALRTAWSALRIISTIILVGIALFMIISQMLNIDAVSPYTFKKMIPRLVAAIILMQLSWYLGILIIDIFNVIGQGIADLLAAPFGGLDKMGSISKILGDYYSAATGGEEAIAYTFLGVGIAASVSAVGGGFGLLALSLTVVIAALVAFVTLVLRKVVILALLLIAPLAIVAWILPNTQNWWKKYFDLTMKLLIMYPLVMGLLTLGKIFAYVVANSGGGGVDNSVNFFIVVLAYFAPFFFIPSMIKASGTIFAKAADNIGKGGGMVRKAGPFKRVDEAREQNIKAREYNRRARGIERASFGGNPVTRAWGRFQAGTAGSYGRAAHQLRADEKAKAISTSSQELQADLDREGITEYDDQVAFMAAVAAGEDHVMVPVRGVDGQPARDANGNLTNEMRRININQAATRSVSAITWLVDKEKDKEVRAAKRSLDARGGQGRAIWAAANQTHGGKIAGIANDLTGRPVTGLSTSQMAGQGGSTLEIYRSQAEQDFRAANTGDQEAHTRLRALAAVARRTLDDPYVQHDITVEKREHLESIAALGGMGTPATGGPAPAPAGGGGGPAGSNQTNAYRINREQANRMTPDNALNYINAQGIQNIHESDLIAIRNAHGASEAGQLAQQELRNRGLLPQQSPQDIRRDHPLP